MKPKPTQPRVCFFQAYYTEYIRALSLKRGLERHGIPINDCRSNEPTLMRYPKALLKLLRQARSSDVVLVNFRAHEILWLVRLLTRKPIIYDAHVSLWQAACEQRGWFAPDSIRGRLLKRLDQLNCALADRILIDTSRHADYFAEELGVDREKFVVAYVSCEDDLFYRRPQEPYDVPTVFWCGSGIPLQGLEVIGDALRILNDRRDPEGFQFIMAGTGPVLDEVRGGLEREKQPNVRFLGRVPRDQIISEYARADICLGGHFGTMKKGENVIGGKVFEMLAMGRPTIVGDSPAVRELLTDREHVLVCPRGSATALADAIGALLDDPGLRDHIGVRGAALFANQLRPEEAVKDLVTVVRDLAQQQ